MKLTNYLPLSVAAIALLASNSAFGGDVVPPPEYYGSASAATIKLTLSVQGEEIMKGDEGNYTITTPASTFRVGNKEILEFLMYFGAEMDGTIEGWSVVYVKGPYNNNEGDEADHSDADDYAEPGQFFITKRGYEPIDISDFMVLDADEFTHWPSAHVHTGNEKFKSSSSSSSSEGTINTSSFSSLWLSFEGTFFALGNLRHQIKYLNYNVYEQSSTSAFLLNSFSLGPITGTVFEFPETDVESDEGDHYLFQGSIYGGKGEPFYYYPYN